METTATTTTKVKTRKKEDAKTCEERVLAELIEAEEKNEELLGEINKMNKTLQYADTILGVLKQICFLKDGGDGTHIFLGSYKFNDEEDKDIIDLLQMFTRDESSNEDENEDSYFELAEKNRGRTK